MPKAERVLDRLVWLDQLLADERRELRATPVAARPGRASRAHPTRTRARRRTHARARRAPRPEARRAVRRAGPGSSRARASGSPPSASIASSCSTKSGLPSATSRIRARVAVVERRAPGELVDQLVGLGRRQRLERDRLGPGCPPTPAGASIRSGRARQRRRIGASRVQSVRCSSRSSSVGSAQWMSSTTSASGRSRASRSNALLTDQEISSGAPACRIAVELVLGAAPRGRSPRAASR